MQDLEIGLAPFIQQNKYNSTVNGTSLHHCLLDRTQKYVEHSISEHQEELVSNKSHFLE